MSSIAERDWKLMRSLKEKKLNQACSKMLESIRSEAQCEENKSHETFLKVWDLINSSNRKVAVMFDDLRRSTAVLKLVAWKKHGILSQEESTDFSEETQSNIESLSK